MPTLAKLHAWIAIAVCASALAQDTAAAEKILLQYKFTPGESLRYDVTHEAKIETTISGTSQTADTVSKSVKHWKVQDLTPQGDATFEHSVDSIDMRHTITGRQEVRYNSETDTEIPFGYEDAAKSVGIPLAVMTVDSQGNLLKREQKHVQPGSSGNSNQILYPMPEEAVAVGHVWTVPQEVDVTLENGGTKKIKTRQRFELQEISPEGIATIGVETQILDVINDPKIEGQLVQRLTKGTITFDTTAGRLIGQDLALDERVVGFSGQGSSMHLKSSFQEKLLPETAAPVAAAEPAKISPMPATNVKKAAQGPAQPAKSAKANPIRKAAPKRK